MNKQSRDRIIIKFSKTIPIKRFPEFEDAARAVGNSQGTICQRDLCLIWQGFKAGAFARITQEDLL